MSHRRLAVALIVAMSLSVPSLSRALPMLPFGTEGLRIVVDGPGPVIATFRGRSASLGSDLYLVVEGLGLPGEDGATSESRTLFDGRFSPVGSQVNLGSYAPGTVLTIRLIARDEDGVAGLPPGLDRRTSNGKALARVRDDWRTGETLISFVGLGNGQGRANDANADDLAFSFTNSRAGVVAEPWSISLLLVGLAAILWTRRRVRA